MKIKIITIASSSEGNCYVIESGDEQLMIECGVSLNRVRESLGFDLSKIVGCLVSHEHADHCGHIGELSMFLNIPVFGPDIAVFPNFRPVDDTFKIQCGDEFFIKPIRLDHGKTECLGYIVKYGSELLLYATDTGSCDYTVPGLTHLMIEANHSLDKLLASGAARSHRSHAADNHLSIDAAVEVAKRHKKTLREIHLIHLSDAHSDEEEFKRRMREATGVPVYVAKK